MYRGNWCVLGALSQTGEIIMNYIKRFFKDPTQSFFLSGPRGTGKSTLVKTRYQDALWFDLLNPKTLRSMIWHSGKRGQGWRLMLLCMAHLVFGH